MIIVIITLMTIILIKVIKAERKGREGGHPSLRYLSSRTTVKCAEAPLPRQWPDDGK